MIRDELTRTPNFTFVQVGACNGVDNDPLRNSILRHQLRGLLVEPIPELFAALRRNYAAQPQLSFAQCAVAEEDGIATMYRIREGAPLPEAAQQLASFDRRNLTTQRQGLPGLDAHIVQVPVPARSLPSLVAEHGLGPITLLVTDAEGYDGTIVRSALEHGLRPRLIMYESVHQTASEQTGLLFRLRDAGYRIAESGMDTYASLT
jgi:FkbM family methyltransferase